MPFKEKGVLFASREILFTLFCCITQLLLDSHKIASICKKTSSHFVRLGVNYWLEITGRRLWPLQAGYKHLQICICHQGSSLACDGGEPKPSLCPVASLQWGLRRTDDLWLCRLKMPKLSSVKMRWQTLGDIIPDGTSAFLRDLALPEMA